MGSLFLFGYFEEVCGDRFSSSAFGIWHGAGGRHSLCLCPFSFSFPGCLPPRFASYYTLLLCAVVDQTQWAQLHLTPPHTKHAHLPHPLAPLLHMCILGRLPPASQALHSGESVFRMNNGRKVSCACLFFLLNNSGQFHTDSRTVEQTVGQWTDLGGRQCMRLAPSPHL